MSLIDQILDIAFINTQQLPPQSRDLARMSLFDWIVCGIGGQQEPVAINIRHYIKGNQASGIASVFGGDHASPVSAALANGTISHALDYDDTHFSHIGHLSVGIFPAALAVAQETGASIDNMVDAFLVGAESAIRIGLVLGSGHYERGFHQTATAGAFGATIAAARLYDLSRSECRAALGLCATRASGLKNQFGTMGKPLNAGYSASNGVECARLAALGMTSVDDGLEGQQGFIETHSEQPSAALDSNGFLFDKIRYKLHACCHGAHAMSEAILKAQDQHGFSIKDVQQLQVSVHPKWLRVCDIKKPRTGLEVKFSYAWLAGMILNGVSTADPKAYTDALSQDSELQAFAEKVMVTGAADILDTAAKISIDLAGDAKVDCEHDLMEEIDSDLLARRLRDKAMAVIGDRYEALWTHIFDNADGSSSDIHSLLAF